jgi:hypothetical protein
MIEATILTGYAKGNCIYSQNVTNIIPSHYPIEFRRFQFPVKLCFAMPMSKTQGQSLKEVGIGLRDECFSQK